MICLRTESRLKVRKSINFYIYLCKKISKRELVYIIGLFRLRVRPIDYTLDYANCCLKGSTKKIDFTYF